MKTKSKDKRLTASLNEAVLRYKEGHKRYFKVIYKVALLRILQVSRSVDFNLYKYGRDDFVQDMMYYVFWHIIDRFDPERGYSFNTYLYKSLKNKCNGFLVRKKRREFLLDSSMLFHSEDNSNSEWSDIGMMRFSYEHAVDEKIILSDYIKKVYKTLTQREKFIFRRLFENRYSNSSKKFKAKLAKEVGLKKAMFYRVVKSIEDKFIKEFERE